MSRSANTSGIAHDVLGRRIGPGETARGEFTYSVVDLPVPDAAWNGRERRAERRLRTRLRDGMIGERRLRVLADCRIRDRSRQGARLQLDKDRPLPRSFVLTDSSTRCCYRAVLVWQVGRDAGVKLTALD